MKCFLIITARKRSLQRLCFYTCLSVILFTGKGDVPGQVPIHRRQVHPPGRYTPLQACTPPGRYTPRPQCMLGYGQQTGGTHPTGMHSCFVSVFAGKDNYQVSSLTSGLVVATSLTIKEVPLFDYITKFTTVFYLKVGENYNWSTFQTKFLWKEIDFRTLFSFCPTDSICTKITLMGRFQFTGTY